MQTPFQCLAVLRPASSDTGSSGYLIAACGPELLSLSLQTGAIDSRWTAEAPGNTDPVDPDKIDENERPIKKQKTTNAAFQPTNVTRLHVSPDNHHVVCATDDKCIRVFEVSSDGKLLEVSQRCMPKRPCALAVTPDAADILCGDKFGDVYSIPLIPDEAEDEAAATVAEVPSKQPAPDFVPAANNLTIHTLRNRRALEAQTKQKSFTPRKEPLKFQHRLLLGHVSMLTDMELGTRVTDGRERTYIITADRDEHIRISRGPPQAHIIERFCLGHTEFISKICVVPGTDILISGGGDSWLGVWDWPNSQLLRRLNLPELLRPEATPAQVGEDAQHVVSGLSTMKVTTDNGTERVLIIWCEKAKVVCLITLSALLDPDRSCVNDTGHVTFRGSCIRLPNYPVGVLPLQDSLVVSLDARELGTDRLMVLNVRQALRSSGDATIVEPASVEGGGLVNIIQSLNQFTGAETTAERVDDLLYGIAALRKRRDQEAGEAELEAPNGED